MPQGPRDSEPPTTTNPPTKTGSFGIPVAPLPPGAKGPEESETPISTNQPPKTGPCPPGSK